MSAAFENAKSALAAIIADYRIGEIAAPDADHVDRWVAQFPEPYRLPILTELAHIFEKSYYSRAKVVRFLAGLVDNPELAGDDPDTFWRETCVLDVQPRGTSQSDMIALFDEALNAKLGLASNPDGDAADTFVYLDDFLFSGGRIRADLVHWIERDAPASATVHVIVIGIHKLGLYFSEGDLEKAIAKSGKTIDVKWWRAIEIEDRKAYIDRSDVLRPVAVPGETATKAYAATLDREIVLRTPPGIGDLKLFSSDDARQLLEQQFLIQGVRARNLSGNFDKWQRPLGRMMMDTLGFGTMMLTYRNCPNNAPLVLWANDPWYPLFPRKTN